MKKIGIVGSRRRNTTRDLEATRKIFNEAYEDGDILVSGGCPKGGDRFCEVFAEELGLTIENEKLVVHEAEWKRYGRGAGMIRNTYIADDSDILIACVAEDRTGGTEDTIKKFEKRGKSAMLVPQVEFDPFDSF